MNLDNVSNLFAQKFIARPDVKAIQHNNGAWSPHTTTGKADAERIPWRREDLKAHLSGERTFGHYLLSKESRCKLFAFDVDLQKAGTLPSLPISPEHEEEEWRDSFGEVDDLRAAWLDRKNPARNYIKLQFKELAHILLRAIIEELELPCIAAYSGAKGIHVYAFTGLIGAEEAREGMQIILDSIGKFKPIRGENFVEHVDYPNFSIELFPKQGTLDGKDLGNLMRLPLGVNLKAPKEPTFFIDMTSPLGAMRPLNPEVALSLNDPWAL